MILDFSNLDESFQLLNRRSELNRLRSQIERIDLDNLRNDVGLSFSSTREDYSLFKQIEKFEINLIDFGAPQEIKLLTVSRRSLLDDFSRNEIKIPGGDSLEQLDALAHCFVLNEDELLGNNWVKTLSDSEVEYFTKKVHLLIECDISRATIVKEEYLRIRNEIRIRSKRNRLDQKFSFQCIPVIRARFKYIDTLYSLEKIKSFISRFNLLFYDLIDPKWKIKLKYLLIN